MELNPILYAGIGLLAVLALGFILTRLYRRAPKDAALIRTGFGGEKVILNGGIMVWPVLHELMHVSLTTIKLKVERLQRDSLITLDKIRVDVTGLFHIRVAPNVEAIAAAAQTLGRRINEEAAVSELVSGKLISALRSAAATMTMEDMHKDRAEFINKVQTLLKSDLATNGLELESVSLTHFDQTKIEFLDENNAFDAEGLTVITKTIEERKKARNEIQAENRVAIEQRNFEANQQSLSIAQKDEFATMEQQRAVAVAKADNDAQIAKEIAQREQEAEQARIQAKRATDTANVEAERAVKEAQIAQTQAIELARQAQQIAVSLKSRDESVAKAEADEARAKAVAAAEAVTTAQQTATAEREKQVAIIQATREAEEQAVGVTVKAKAEKEAATNRADALKIAATAEAEAATTKARGEADAEKLRAEAAEVTYRVNAEGQSRLLEAKNKQSEQSMAFDSRMALVEAMPKIIEQQVKPLQQIESIRITDISGLNGVAGNGGDGSVTNLTSGGSGNFADQAVSAALKYRATSPVLDSLMGEMFGNGVDTSNPKNLVTALQTPAVGSSPAPARDEAPTKAEAPRKQPTSKQVADAYVPEPIRKLVDRG